MGGGGGWQSSITAPKQNHFFVESMQYHLMWFNYVKNRVVWFWLLRMTHSESFCSHGKFINGRHMISQDHPIFMKQLKVRSKKQISNSTVGRGFLCWFFKFHLFNYKDNVKRKSEGLLHIKVQNYTSTLQCVHTFLSIQGKFIVNEQ